MSELVGEMGDPMELPEEPGQGLYVLTNKSKQMGAATIFYPDVADKIEALFPNGCYVIPSSIHELLLTSKDTLPPEDIAAMVREINNTQVATEDLLSYKVHEYDPKTRTIGLAGGGKDLGQQKAEEQSSRWTIWRSQAGQGDALSNSRSIKKNNPMKQRDGRTGTVFLFYSHRKKGEHI